MTVLLDTHAWVWSLTDAERLTDTARDAIATAEVVYVSPFDRIIAATAMELKCPLVSKDREFEGLDEMAAWQGRIWSGARSAKGLR